MNKPGKDPATRKLTLRIHRPWTERFEDEEGRKGLHRERSTMIHGLVDTLGIEIEDWGDTDSDYPREWVEIAIAIGSAAVSAAVAEIVKAWFERKKVRDIEIVRPNGTTISVRGMTRDELKELGRVLWSKAERRKH